MDHLLTHLQRVPLGTQLHQFVPQFPLPLQGRSQGESQGTQIPGFSQSAATPKQTFWQSELVPHASWQQVESQLPSLPQAVSQHDPVHVPIQFPKHDIGSPTQSAVQETVQLLLQSEPASASTPSGTVSGTSNANAIAKLLKDHVPTV